MPTPFEQFVNDNLGIRGPLYIDTTTPDVSSIAAGSLGSKFVDSSTNFLYEKTGYTNADWVKIAELGDSRGGGGGGGMDFSNFTGGWNIELSGDSTLMYIETSKSLSGSGYFFDASGIIGTGDSMPFVVSESGQVGLNLYTGVEQGTGYVTPYHLHVSGVTALSGSEDLEFASKPALTVIGDTTQVGDLSVDGSINATNTIKANVLVSSDLWLTVPDAFSATSGDGVEVKGQFVQCLPGDGYGDEPNCAHATQPKVTSKDGEIFSIRQPYGFEVTNNGLLYNQAHATLTVLPNRSGDPTGVPNHGQVGVNLAADYLITHTGHEFQVSGSTLLSAGDSPYTASNPALTVSGDQALFVNTSAIVDVGGVPTPIASLLGPGNNYISGTTIFTGDGIMLWGNEDIAGNLRTLKTADGDGGHIFAEGEIEIEASGYRMGKTSTTQRDNGSFDDDPGAVAKFIYNNTVNEFQLWNPNIQEWVKIETGVAGS